jgi:hypothetical protein
MTGNSIARMQQNASLSLSLILTRKQNLRMSPKVQLLVLSINLIILYTLYNMRLFAERIYLEIII